MGRIDFWTRRTLGIIIRAKFVLRRTGVRIGVERAGTATIVWVVPIEAWTIFPPEVFGFNLEKHQHCLWLWFAKLPTPLQW